MLTVVYVRHLFHYASVTTHVRIHFTLPSTIKIIEIKEVHGFLEVGSGDGPRGAKCT